MKFEIRTTRVDLGTRTREYIERRFRFALGRFASRIERVAIDLEDVNGPRGGVDIHCKVAVDLVWGDRMILETESSDVAGAIDRSADRAGRAVARLVERYRRHDRSVIEMPVEEAG